MCLDFEKSLFRLVWSSETQKNARKKLLREILRTKSTHTSLSPPPHFLARPFFLAVFFRVSLDELRERGTTRSLLSVVCSWKVYGQKRYTNTCPDQMKNLLVWPYAKSYQHFTALISPRLFLLLFVFCFFVFVGICRSLWRCFLALHSIKPSLNTMRAIIDKNNSV